MFKLVGLKSKSQDAPAPMTKTADRGRRNIKTNWSHLMPRRSHKLGQKPFKRQTIDSIRPFNGHDPNESTQNQTSIACDDRRYVPDNLTETWIYDQKDPNELHLNSDRDCRRVKQKVSVLSGTLQNMLDRVQVAVSSGEAGVCCIVRTLSSSRQTPQLLEQVDMEVEVTIASDRSVARGKCARTSSGKMRLLSISEPWCQRLFTSDSQSCFQWTLSWIGPTLECRRTPRNV